LTGVREVVHLLSELDAALLMTAVALGNWHGRHRYAPASGQLTTVREGGWVRADEAGENLWPRTDPAVIVLVHDGVPGESGRCLLGQQRELERGRGTRALPRTRAWPASSSRANRRADRGPRGGRRRSASEPPICGT